MAINNKKSNLKKIICCAVALTVFFSQAASYAQSPFVSMLPEPGVMVAQSQAYVPVMVRGLVIHPDQPLNFDFIVDSGNDSPDAAVILEQSDRIAKYFLAALTVPEDQLWVNLSPYEKDRIIETELGQTVLGRDMLAQDYVLKQLTASLIYPEQGLGKEFWDKVYKQAAAKFGTTEIPVDTFNKVWITPERAEVFEKGTAVYVTGAHLKVMLDSDYTAMSAQKSGAGSVGDDAGAGSLDSSQRDISQQILREVVLPAIEKEVNEGKNFSVIRQIYYAAILAKWYREIIKNTLLSEAYVGKNRVAGVTTSEKTLKEEIYQRYIAAYKKGVFNLVREETDPLTGEALPKKYFSGGITDFAMQSVPLSRTTDVRAAGRPVGRAFKVDFALSQPDQSTGSDAAMSEIKPVAPVAGVQNDLARKRQEDLRDKKKKKEEPAVAQPEDTVEISDEARALLERDRQLAEQKDKPKDAAMSEIKPVAPVAGVQNDLARKQQEDLRDKKNKKEEASVVQPQEDTVEISDEARALLERDRQRAEEKDKPKDAAMADVQLVSSVLSANVTDAAMLNDLLQAVQNADVLTVAGVTASAVATAAMARYWWLRNTVAGNIRRAEKSWNIAAMVWLIRHEPTKVANMLGGVLQNPAIQAALRDVKGELLLAKVLETCIQTGLFVDLAKDMGATEQQIREIYLARARLRKVDALVWVMRNGLQSDREAIVSLLTEELVNKPELRLVLTEKKSDSLLERIIEIHVHGYSSQIGLMEKMGATGEQMLDAQILRAGAGKADAQAWLIQNSSQIARNYVLSNYKNFLLNEVTVALALQESKDGQLSPVKAVSEKLVEDLMLFVKRVEMEKPVREGAYDGEIVNGYRWIQVVYPQEGYETDGQNYDAFYAAGTSGGWMSAVEGVGYWAFDFNSLNVSEDAFRRAQQALENEHVGWQYRLDYIFQVARIMLAGLAFRVEPYSDGLKIFPVASNKDAAALNGGIDIQNIDVQHKPGTEAIRFNEDAVRGILQNGFNGFTPVILNITPVADPLLIMGVVSPLGALPSSATAKNAETI